MLMSEDISQPEWFDKEVINCPACKQNYERIVIDDQQIVCPRCLNKEWIEE